MLFRAKNKLIKKIRKKLYFQQNMSLDFTNGKKDKKISSNFLYYIILFLEYFVFPKLRVKKSFKIFFFFQEISFKLWNTPKKRFQEIFSCNRVKTKFSETFVFKWNSVTIIFVLRSNVKKNFRMFSQMKIKIRGIYRCNTASGHWARSEANLNCLSKYYWTE